jgi:hypothetical protein
VLSCHTKNSLLDFGKRAEVRCFRG